MPSESDPRIESILQAYARQRRKAGEPELEMDPGTRSRLQAEVSRVYRSQPAGEHPRHLWAWLQALWPRLAWIASVCLVAGLFLQVLRSPANLNPARQGPATTRTRSPAPLPAAQQTSSQPEPTPAVGGPLPAKTEPKPVQTQAVAAQTGDATPVILNEPSEKRAFLFQPTETVPSLAPSAASRSAKSVLSPGSQGSHAGSVLARSAPEISHSEASADLNPTAVRRSVAGQAANWQLSQAVEDSAQVPPAAAPVVAVAASSPSRTEAPAIPNPREVLRWRFSPSQSPPRGLAQPSPTVALRGRAARASSSSNRALLGQTPVMNSFVVEQSGNQITIVDQDGSRYNGGISVVPAKSTVASYGLAQPVATPAAPPGKSLSTASPMLQTQPTLTVYAVHAAGSNQTLNRAISFKGSLTPLRSGLSRTQGPAQASGALIAARPTDLTLETQPQYRLLGRVEIGGSKQVEIDAIGQAP